LFPSYEYGRIVSFVHVISRGLLQRAAVHP